MDTIRTDISDLEAVMIGLLCVISFLTFIPQILKLYEAKSSDGVSIMSLFYTNVMRLFQTANIVVLHWDQFAW